MKLSPTENAFVEKRERQAKYWPWAGGFMLAMVFAYGGWLWMKLPQLINPWHVIEGLESGTLSDSTIRIMALMLPMVMATLLVFLVFIVLMWFVPFRNERRLIRLVRKLEAKSGGRDTDG